MNKEATFETQLKVEKYLNNKGLFISSVENHTDISNYHLGDATFHCVSSSKDGGNVDVNVDYKQQTRSDGKTAFIELIQVGANGNYDSWLYNSNIHLVVYELKNGECYIIPHSTLIALARKYNTDVAWNRCIVYSQFHRGCFEEERAWVNSKLSAAGNETTTAGTIVGTTIKDDEAFVNGCYNFNSRGGKVHSGFCLNIHFDQLKEFCY